MRLYTHTHTCVLTNKKNDKQKEVEKIGIADNSWRENVKSKNSASTLINYVNSSISKENYKSGEVEKRINNKAEQKEKTRKIKKKEGKLQKVSCLLVMRKIIVAVILMIIVLAILVGFGVRYNWKIENIIEEIGKVIDINGTGAEIEEVAAMDMTKVDLVPDKNGVNVPVPKGYVLSGASDENSVTGGAVIYEGETAVTNSNKATAKLTRNQFVWVPVSSENVSRIYSEDAYGRKSGKLYDYSSNGRTEKSTGSYSEPRILTNKNDGDFQQYNLYGYTQNKLYEEMQKNYEETIESIKTYGGFYIGRYETGNLSKVKPVVVQYNLDIRNQTWYTMYNKVQYLGGSAGVKSMIIYGSLWDEVMMWLHENLGKSWSSIGDYSTNWGNYYNSTFDYYDYSDSVYTKTKELYTASIMDTGIRTNPDKRNCASNIYDLAGNVQELTQEAVGSTAMIARGWEYTAYNQERYYAAYRSSSYPTEVDWETGTRVQLIIS